MLCYMLQKIFPYMIVRNIYYSMFSEQFSFTGEFYTLYIYCIKYFTVIQCSYFMVKFLSKF